MKEHARNKDLSNHEEQRTSDRVSEGGSGNGDAITHRICTETAGSAFEIALTIEVRPIV